MNGMELYEICSSDDIPNQITSMDKMFRENDDEHPNVRERKRH